MTFIISIMFSLCIISRMVEADGGSKLLIDHDGGADDAMAIFMALLYETHFGGPKVVGLTTVHGNVNETQGFKNTQKILNVARRPDVPIYRGSPAALAISYPTDNFFGSDGLGDIQNMTYVPIKQQPEHAVLALIELSKKLKGHLTVLSIGSLTNIALAIKIDPSFIHRLAHLYIAAGNIYSENHQEPEFNAKMDVEAYYIVTKHAKPEKVTVIPFSAIMDSFNITMDWRKNVLGAISTPIMKAQNMFERISEMGETMWSLLDPIAMSMVLNHDIIKETKCSHNSIILCGESRGINTNNFTQAHDANVKVVTAENQSIFQTFAVKLFSADPQV